MYATFPWFGHWLVPTNLPKSQDLSVVLEHFWPQSSALQKDTPSTYNQQMAAWLIAFLLSNVSLLVGRQSATAALKKGLTWDDRFPTELGRANHPFSWKLEGMQALRLKYGTIIFWRSPSVFNKKSRWKNYERNQAKRLNLQAEQAVGHIWRSRSSCITDAVMALHLLPWAMVAPL